MQRLWLAGMLVLGLGMSKPAFACMADEPIVLSDVSYADVVVVGRISGYEIVRADPSRQTIWDFARFAIDIDEVLVGNVPDHIFVTWDNSTFAEPEMIPEGTYLVALRLPTSAMPPLRGPSATILANAEPHLLAVLQAPCSSPFLFENTSEEARSIRQILTAQR